MSKRFVRTHWLLISAVLALAPVRARAETAPAEPLPLLPGLETPVEFWKRIFGEFSVTQLVLFDPLDMSVIYDVVEVGDENLSQREIDAHRRRVAAERNVDPDRVKAQRGIKERTAAGLRRAGRYLGQIQEIFRERGLPVELSYLPLVESSFDINARSRAGALGMWQFMRRTGRQFLRIDCCIDERKDPLESTRAAAELLARNYQVLGNWPLAITAYNYGTAGMARAVAEVESDNLVELIERYTHPNWGYPSKNFYAEFLAAVEIARNVERYFPGLDPDPPLAVREVEVRNRTSLATLIRSTGLSRSQFFEWNPALSSSTRTVPAGYRLKLPADRRTEPVVEVRYRPADEPVIRHRVKPGETLSRIARRYRTPVEKILEANGIRKTSLLRAGTTLLIPKL
ncbi:MAG TPA: transglycosylase SLT domain-containing protein [candidate division Zixibacteria bacterium]|nr:transglycosylase SLT domain-containing protein [candidate division Zixibacteria bacterium]